MTRVVFMGTPDFAAASLTALMAAGYDVVGVLTRPDQPAGRGQRVEESPVKRLARANGVPVLQPGTLRDPEAQAAIAALEPDVAVVAAYGLLIPQAVLDLPPFHCLNVHGSLLPRWRGAAPITAAILAGDAESGITIMQLDPGLDTGPIISQARLPIAPDDTTGSLSQKLAVLGAELLTETLPGWLRGQIAPRQQNESLATYAPRLDKEAGEIDWQRPAVEIERQVRAYQPWPSAFTSWKGQRLKVIGARTAAERADLPAGTVVGNAHRAGVVTGAGTLWLEEVQLAGKRILAVDVFLRGAAGFVGSQVPS